MTISKSSTNSSLGRLIEPASPFRLPLASGDGKGGFAAAGGRRTVRFISCQPRPCRLCSSRLTEADRESADKEIK